MIEPDGKRVKFALLAFSVQIIFLIVFLLYIDYDSSVKPLLSSCHRKSYTNIVISTSELEVSEFCPAVDPVTEHVTRFQDTLFLVVSAFGLAYCIIAHHALSSLSGSFLIMAIGAQWGILCRNFLFTNTYPIYLNVLSLLGGVSSVPVVLISWGCVLGKLSPVQLLVLVLCEIPIATTNEWLATNVIQVKDIGGSMLRHEFGAYFGIAVSVVLYRRDMIDHSKSTIDVHSSFRGFMGTMLFWILWPTAVAAPLTGSDRDRVFINVFISMLSSCFSTFALSSVLDKDGKFGVQHVHNASVAGGVAIGSAADSLIGPGGALLSGICGGIVAVLGITYVQPFLENKLYIHDTVAIFSLHGLVGMLGGLVGALAVGIATEQTYGYGLYHVFPTLIPKDNTSGYNLLLEEIPSILPGLGRTAEQQAGYQIVVVIMCILIPILSGIVTGFVLRMPFFDGPSGEQLFDDRTYWRLPFSADHINEIEEFVDDSSVPSQARSESVTEEHTKRNAVAPVS